MKRIVIAIAALAACVSINAQNPKAVIKAILAGEDKASVTQKYDKAVEKHDFGEPAMILANDMILHSEGQSVFAYLNWCTHKEEIENDEDVQKIMKSLKANLQDIFYQIESVSAIKVMDEDSEAAYDKYINVAERNSHPMLAALNSAREARAFADVRAANTIAEYDRFIGKYPEASKNRMDEVVAQRTDLVFDTVMVSTNEQGAVDFIADYPSYSRLAEVQTHLSDIRYDKSIADGGLEALHAFWSMYPEYPKIAEVVSRLSVLEYDRLDTNDLAAVAAYVETYPLGAHTPELVAKLAHEKMIEAGDLKAMFAYVREKGYDAEYSRIIRSAVAKHGKAIVTPDIREVDLVRFIDAAGKVGYWNLNGDVVIEPVFEDAFPMGEYPYDIVYGVEFLAGRNAAAVYNGGLWGVANTNGEMALPLNGIGIVMEDKVTLLMKKTSGGSRPEYSTEVYDFTGAPITMGTWVTPSETPACDRRGEFVPGTAFEFKNGRVNSRVNVCLEPTGFYRYIVNHDGSTLNQKLSNFKAYTDEYVVTERGLTNCENWLVSGPDPYDDHNFIKDGRILVCKGGKWGYLDSNLAVAIPLQFDAAEDFCGTTALVDKCRLIDAAGNTVFEASSITPLKSSLPDMKWAHYTLYRYEKDGATGIVDSCGCIISDNGVPAGGLVEILGAK